MKYLKLGLYTLYPEEMVYNQWETRESCASSHSFLPPARDIQKLLTKVETTKQTNMKKKKIAYTSKRIQN